MKEIIIQLIECDIKIARLVLLLGKDNIDTRSYLPSSSRCVFDLVGIDVQKLDDQNLRTQYLVMINELASLDSGVTISQMRPYLEKIFLTLRKW